MINKICNWVFGSFFRTIGRLLVFVLLGVIIASVVDFGDIFDNFRITDLFFERTYALTITNEVIKKETTIITQDDNYSSWTDEWGKYSSRIYSQSGIFYDYVQFVQDSGILANHDYAEISFSVSQPLSSTQTWQAQDDFVTCQRYNCESYNTSGVCQQWKCATWYGSGTSEAQTAVEHNTSITIFNFFYTMVLSDNTTTNCSVNNNTIVCPLNKKKPKALRLYVNFPTSYSTSTKFILDRNMSYYDSATNQIIEQQQATTDAITNQTQQQEQQHQEMMDSNTTQAEDEASDFLGNFTVEDTGGLNAIITAPLSTIQSLLNNTCNKLVLPLPFVSKNLELPCLYPIYNDYFGAFFTIYQTIILGIISYRCIKSLFFDIKGFTNPEDDRIEVMDL